MILQSRVEGARRARALRRSATAIGALLALSLHADRAFAADGPAAIAPGWLVAVLALGAGLVASAWAVIGLMRGRQRLLDELRAARARDRCLAPLLDVWTWQSDAEHRLIALRPPSDAPPSAWRGMPAARGPAPLGERFRAEAPDVLEARLSAGAALDALPVRLADTAGSGGQARAGLLSGRPYTDAGGALAGYHGTFREQGDAAAPATARVDDAAAAAPMAEPAPAAAGEQELLGLTLSHDLRAPIRVVEGFTKIVKEDYGTLLDRIGNDHLDRVLGAAARMNNMIDALMALSRLSSQPLARQPVNLSQLANFVVDDLRRQWPERQVETTIEPGLQVTGDPTLLRVVLENLLGNAWKYTGKTADARISLSCAPGEPPVFTVADNGAGFDMRFADRLFGVFQRLHSAGEFPGTGIGLATVRRIVRRHGGDIWCEAEVDAGARFHMSLPRG